MKVSPDYYDEIFDFKGEWDMPSSCGLKIRESEGKQYVIVTELYQDNPGTSVTYAGKKLADQICEAKGLNPADIVYVECNPNTNSKLSFYDEVSHGGWENKQMKSRYSACTHKSVNPR